MMLRRTADVSGRVQNTSRAGNRPLLPFPPPLVTFALAERLCILNSTVASLLALPAEP